MAIDIADRRGVGDVGQLMGKFATVQNQAAASMLRDLGQGVADHKSGATVRDVIVQDFAEPARAAGPPPGPPGRPQNRAGACAPGPWLDPTASFSARGR